LAMVEQHLSGERPLGIVPVRSDGLCRWGSIDIDDYGADLIAVVSAVERAKLPLVCCRSKSGGLHLYLFMADWAPAAVVRDWLTRAAATAGFPRAEIFPKQDQLVIDERDDAGSWILLPYYGGTFDGRLKEQVLLKQTGAEGSLLEFLDLAEKARVAPGELVKKPTTTTPGGIIDRAPPCIEWMEAEGVSEP